MEILSAIGGFLAGAALGSFFSATALAWLEHRPVLITRSVCDHCGKKLPARCLVPVVSYLFLRGKCACCGGKIPAFHFFVEISSALVCALVAMRAGPHLIAVFYMPVASALVTASAIDIKSGLLPDFITLGCLVFVPPLVFLNPDLTLKDAVIGYAAGGGMPLLLYLLFRLVRKKEALGLGDIKLYALGGALTGWHALPFLFFFSAFAGILVFGIYCLLGEKMDLWNREIPFGPSICAAILAILLWPQLPGLVYGLVG